MGAAQRSFVFIRSLTKTRYWPVGRPQGLVPRSPPAPSRRFSWSPSLAHTQTWLLPPWWRIPATNLPSGDRRASSSSSSRFPETTARGSPPAVGTSTRRVVRAASSTKAARMEWPSRAQSCGFTITFGSGSGPQEPGLSPVRAHDAELMPVVRVDDLGAIRRPPEQEAFRFGRPAGGGAVDQGLLVTRGQVQDRECGRTPSLPAAHAEHPLAIGGELGEGRRLEPLQLDLSQHHARAFVIRGRAERGDERPAAGRAQGEQDRDDEPRCFRSPPPGRRPGRLVEPELAAGLPGRELAGVGEDAAARLMHLAVRRGGPRPSPTGSPCGRPASGRRRSPSRIRGVAPGGC